MPGFSVVTSWVVMHMLLATGLVALASTDPGDPTESGRQRPVTVSSELVTGLVPGGAPHRVRLRLENPAPVPVHLRTLKLDVSRPGCLGTSSIEVVGLGRKNLVDRAYDSTAADAPQYAIPAQGTVTLPALTVWALKPAGRPAACKVTTLRMTFSGTATLV